MEGEGDDDGGEGQAKADEIEQIKAEDQAKDDIPAQNEQIKASKPPPAKQAPKLTPILIPLPSSPKLVKKSAFPASPGAIDPLLIKVDKMDPIKLPKNMRIDNLQK